MQTVPDGFMQDSRGRLVPEANVRPSDKLQDELVRRLHREAEPVRQFMMDFKRLCFAEIDRSVENVARFCRHIRPQPDVAQNTQLSM